MTNLDDFDRSLNAFLVDGPTIAPEPPVIAALAHARTTPRRRDPMAAVRRDVMARPLTIAGLRPGLALAAAALLLAVIGIAIVGGGRNRETLPTPSVGVVVPGTSTSAPSPSAQETPHLSIAPSVTPTPLPRVTTLPPLAAPAVAPIHVKLDQCCSDALSVDVVDESSHLTAARSGPPVEGGSVDALTAANDDDRTLRITWPGSPCDAVHRLTIDPSATTFTIDRPQCFGDATPSDRIVILTFDLPVRASDVRGSVVTGRGGVDFPSWTTTAIDGAGRPVQVALLDRSQSVTRLEPVDVTGMAALGGDRQMSDEPENRIRMLWNGCDAGPTLVIDETAHAWTLVDPTRPCATPTLRGLDLSFTGPLRVDTVLVSDAAAVP